MVRAIDEGVTRYRAERSPAQLRRDAFLALGITLAFLAAGYIFLRLFRFVESYFERIYQARISKLGEQTRAIVEAGALRDSVLNTLRVLRVAILCGGVLIWLNLVLGSFPWTRPFSQRVVQLLVDPLTAVGLGVIAYVPNLAFLIVLFFVIRLALRLTELFFNAVATGTIEIPNFASEWAIPTFRLARFAIGIFALVIAYPYLPGSGSDAFKGLSLFVGAVISFGSSGVIGNVIAGYSLIYRRAYRIGDRVQIGEHIGDVELMRMQVTHLRSVKNEEIIVPNSLVLTSTVINYSSLAKERGLILHTTVGIGYEVPWRQVESMLLMAATRTKELLSQPPPFVIQKSLGDFAVVYELNVYCDQPDKQSMLYGKLHRNILDVFNEFSVQIMTPAYEGDPETPKVVPKEKWFPQPAEANDRPVSVVKTPGRTATT
jgi:small-conductance mechanosensitive channel